MVCSGDALPMLVPEALAYVAEFAFAVKTSSFLLALVRSDASRPSVA